MSETEVTDCKFSFLVRLGLVRVTSLLGEFSRLLLLKNSIVLLIGEMVRSGDSVIRCVMDLTGDEGESKLMDLARVSAINFLACSRKRCCRSS